MPIDVPIEADTPRRENIAAGFDFARQLRDPAFRAHLRSVGYGGGVVVYVARPDEPLADVLGRVAEAGLLAVPDAAGMHGWALVWIGPADIRVAERERVAAYLERMAAHKLANSKDSVAPQFGECEAMVLTEAVAAIREPSVRAPEDSDESAPDSPASPTVPAQDAAPVPQDTPNRLDGFQADGR